MKNKFHIKSMKITCGHVWSRVVQLWSRCGPGVVIFSGGQKLCGHRVVAKIVVAFQ